MTRKKTLILVLILVVLAGAIGGGLYWRAHREEKTTVRTIHAGKKTLVSLVTANGTIEARTKVDVASNIMGQITELNVEEGETVEKGDLLLVIDPAQYSAAVQGRQAGMESLQSELTRAREAAAQAQRDLARAEQQYRDEILPAADYDRAKSAAMQTQSAVKTAERQVAASRADLAAAHDELKKTEIRAPMSGLITRRNVEKGEVVVTGTMNNAGTVLLTISDMAVIEAVLEVDQTDMPSLRIGQPVTVLIDAFPGAPFPGVVTEIGSSPLTGLSALGGSATGTDYEVKVTLTHHPEGVRPGLTVTADITTATRPDVLAIPIGALVVREEGATDTPSAGDGAANGEAERKSTDEGLLTSVAERTRDVEGVYLVRDGRVVFQKVTSGIQGETDLEILSGLQPGDEIVTGPFKALRELKPGDPVEVDNVTTPESS